MYIYIYDICTLLRMYAASSYCSRIFFRILSTILILILASHFLLMVTDYPNYSPAPALQVHRACAEGRHCAILDVLASVVVKLGGLM